MEIIRKKIKIKDLIKGFYDNNEMGCVGYDGKLNIRPAYQREFVYKGKQQEAVIETILKGFPLNVIYWVENEDGTYEVLDGQQRTLSICYFMWRNKENKKRFAVNHQYSHNIEKDQLENIENYELDVYICKGKISEKIEWFEVINTAGEKLNSQELLNAAHTGKWLSDAKANFSKRKNCRGSGEKTKKYFNGSSIRQDILKTILKWISNGKIEDYMNNHRHDENANELVNYYDKVIEWVEKLFPNYNKIMKGIEWGILYNKYHQKYNEFHAEDFAKEIEKLILNDDVKSKKGIYEYLLSKNKKHLNLRTFDQNLKPKYYQLQNGKCKICDKKLDIDLLHMDHIIPWSKNGKTVESNLQLLCKTCNSMKGNK